jgi:uncharacterized integral membrane protein
MGESTGKLVFKVLRYGLLCGLITGISTLFLLFLLSSFLIGPTDPIDIEFYSGYCFRVPLAAAMLGTVVGAILALIIDSREKLLINISVSALVIGIIASLIGLNLLLSWKGI